MLKLNLRLGEFLFYFIFFIFPKEWAHLAYFQLELIEGDSEKVGWKNLKELVLVSNIP